MRWFTKKTKATTKADSQSAKTPLFCLYDTYMKQQKYDANSGQVYNESTKSIGQARDWDAYWENRVYNAIRKPAQGAGYLTEYKECVSPYSKSWSDGNARLHNGRTVRGTLSLQELAIEKIVDHISDMTLEVIKALPVLYVRRIWEELNKRDIVSFNIWVIFKTVLRKEANLPLNLLRYRFHIQKPSAQITIYTAPLISPSFDFLTHLSITHSFSLSELVSIWKIRNLGVLEVFSPSRRHHIVPNPNQINADILIRAWSRAASEEGAFPVLRVLKLCNFESLTQLSITYLNNFPVLAVFDVQGCELHVESKTQALTLGWRAIAHAMPLNILSAACRERAVQLRVRLGLEVANLRNDPAEQLEDDREVKTIPRCDVPAFIVRPCASLLKRDPTESNPLILKGLMKDILEDEMEAKMPSEDLSYTDLLDNCQRYIYKTWEFYGYTHFCKIGELRNDTDLKRAGIEIGEQAIVGRDLISSIPMACMRLGPSEEIRTHITTDDSKDQEQHPQKLAFVRIKLPQLPKGEVRRTRWDEGFGKIIRLDPPDQASLSKEAEANGVIVRDFASMGKGKGKEVRRNVVPTIVSSSSNEAEVLRREVVSPTPSLKRSSGSGQMRRKKKVKLADVLGSFLN